MNEKYAARFYHVQNARRGRYILWISRLIIKYPAC